MTKLISQKINCSLPWSSFKIQGLKECNTETDFDNYLIALDDLQDAFKKLARSATTSPGSFFRSLNSLWMEMEPLQLLVR